MYNLKNSTNNSTVSLLKLIGSPFQIKKYFEYDETNNDELYATSIKNRIPLFFLDILNEKGKLNNLKIFDITPTILHMFGLPIPKDIDGRVLTEIFDEKSKPAKRKIVYQEFKETDKIRNSIKRLKLLKKI